MLCLCVRRDHELSFFFVILILIILVLFSEIIKWGASKEEQAATWTFVMLDKDKNKALERREWKAYHQLISNVEPLKRCGRKLPRYCDVNHDTKISITEWMACLEVTQASLGVTSKLKRPISTQHAILTLPLDSLSLAVEW